MPITARAFQDILASAVTYASTKARVAIDTTVGSVVRAILEAATLQDLYNQSLILQAQQIQRAATATGADLDSFMADFGFTRLAAVPATGTVTFARYTTNASAPFVANGTLVQSNVGGLQFKVVADTTQAAYSTTLGGYTMPANAASVAVTVQAVTPGTSGNVAAGAIAILVNSVPGVDTVTNGTGFTSGLDAEGDAALRARFVTYIQGLSKATAAAIDAAIGNVRQGLSWVKLENQNFAGATQNGFFAVVAQDGSGTLTAAEQSAINAAINTARPFTVNFSLNTPTNVTTNFSTTAILPTGVSAADASAAKAAAGTAVTAYINALAIGATVPIRRIEDVAINAMIASLAAAYSTIGVSVNGSTLNGATTDLAIATTSIARAGTITVN